MLQLLFTGKFTVQRYKIKLNFYIKAGTFNGQRIYTKQLSK
jgi:hypothetical protein